MKLVLEAADLVARFLDLPGELAIGGFETVQPYHHLARILGTHRQGAKTERQGGKE